MNKILSTGHTGTIGKHFGNDVVKPLINLPDIKNLQPILSGSLPNIVLHAAAVVNQREIQEDPYKAYQVNVEGTKKLALFARDELNARFVFVSTSHVYAQSSEKLSESSKIDPVNIYSIQKRQAEIEIIEVFRNNPTQFCIVRVFSCLDWDVPEFTLGGKIRSLILPGSSVRLSYADDVRDFLTPKQIAQNLIKIAQHRDVHGIVNLCTGIETTVKAAALRMIKESNIEFDVNRIDSGHSSIPVILGDNSKVLSFGLDLDLNWKPSKISTNHS
jgi:UDP-glucose 4-epimerase/GDP-4-dehydro-6-deoxy-D-mannose reductase